MFAILRAKLKSFGDTETISTVQFPHDDVQTWATKKDLHDVQSCYIRWYEFRNQVCSLDVEKLALFKFFLISLSRAN